MNVIRRAYYINLDIQNSTLLWRCNETEMVEAFVKEWFIIYTWFNYLKTNGVSIELKGQFGDEWRFIINTDEITLKEHCNKLMNTLEHYINVPKYDKNNLKNSIICEKNRRSSSKGILFRIGIDETESGAIQIESECEMNYICIKKNKYQLMSPDDYLRIDVFPEVTDVFIKKKLFYVFLYHHDNDKIKEYVEKIKGSFIKTKFYDLASKMRISSITFQNMESYTEFIMYCLKSKLLYSNTYGDVYAVNKSSSYKSMFLKEDDVYGDHINTAAKVLVNLIKLNTSRKTTHIENENCSIM